MPLNGVAGNPTRPATSGLSLSTRDLFAGLISSLLAVVYGLSFAALIFGGPLTPLLSYGISATFAATAVSAALVAWRSSIPFAIAGPDPTTVAVTSTLVAALVGKLAASASPDSLLGPVMIVMAVSAALTGLLMLGLGIARAGGMIRFIPYPVIGGFLGATGWLMLSGAARVISGYGIEFATLDDLIVPPALTSLLAGAAVATALYLGLRSRPNSTYIVPLVVLGAIGATYLHLLLSGTSLAEARAEGWMFEAPAAAALAHPWGLSDLKAFPWHLLPALSGDLLAVMFVTVISTLLNTTGVEFVTRREADLERELKTIGAANLLAATLGGYASTVALNRTTLNYAAGGRGRLCGLTVAAISLSMLAVNPSFLAYVPKFALGGILLYLGAALMYQWLAVSARRLSFLEYASLLAIALIIIHAGFIAGVVIGVIIGCATFAFSASRVNAIKFSFDGSEYRSSLDRGTQELSVLANYGHQIQGMSLQSYLFFGSANRLYQHVKALIARRPDCRFLLFDFRLVTGIDSSAMHSFTQIKQAAEEVGAKLILVNLPVELDSVFRNRRFISDNVTVSSDLDRALESCEQAVIADHLALGSQGKTLTEWLAQALGSTQFAEQLAAVCERLEVQEGEIIAAQGEPARSMHFILHGRVGIIVRTEDGRSVRVRSLGSHTTIGEMGLITSSLRSATIEAEVPSVLYELSADAFARIKKENGALSQALLTYVVTIMTERLSFASRVIGVLRR